MTSIAQICEYLEAFAPVALAEEWDNVGLLVGDRTRPAAKVMTCLTVTTTTAREAIDTGADLIVTHHPLPFRPLKRITADNTTGRMLLELIAAGVSIYSPHTAFDSAGQGINQQLAAGLGLADIAPLVPGEVELGSGRHGTLLEPQTLSELAERLKAFLRIENLHRVGPSDQQLGRVAVACGSAGEFLKPAAQLRCDCLILGETNFHTCLEAEAIGVGLLLCGHYPSERFALETLAGLLQQQFADTEIWASRLERDPLIWC